MHVCVYRHIILYIQHLIGILSRLGAALKRVNEVLGKNLQGASSTAEGRALSKVGDLHVYLFCMYTFDRGG